MGGWVRGVRFDFSTRWREACDALRPMNERQRIVEALHRLRLAAGATSALWLRAAVGPNGAPIIADVLADPPRELALEGRALGTEVERPRARWISDFVEADVLPALCSALPGDFSKPQLSILAGEQKLFGVVVLGRVLDARALDRPRAQLKLRVEEAIVEQEARPAGKVILDQSGALLFTCPHGQYWWNEVTGLERAAPASGVYRGVSIAVEPLMGTASDALMVHLNAPAPVMLARDANLTRAQRVVADYAAAGATIPEIARSVRSSPETVRTHLREVYRRLGVSCRVELLRALAPS